jgi:hypothetical protein
MSKVAAAEATVLRIFPSESEDSVEHKVRLRPGGGYLSCTCRGYRFTRRCWHVDEVMKTLPGQSPVGLLAAALDYAAQGFHVIPVEPGGKIPMVPWLKYQGIAPTATELARWWKFAPFANIGLILGQGRIAVDLDGGSDAEALLATAGIQLPADAPRVRTASGFHVYLAADGLGDRIGLFKGAPRADGSETPGGKVRVAQVDIRAKGIIIAPPSRHSTGVDYEWVTPLRFPLPQAPDALVAAVRSTMPPQQQSLGL